jgi:hypothetical protein
MTNQVETEYTEPVNEGASRTVDTVETLAAVAACVVALLLSFVFGRRAMVGQPWVVVAGLVLGEVCAGIYLGLANWAGRTWSGLLDPRLVGVHFMALIVVAGICGVLGAWFGYRKSLGRGLF